MADRKISELSPLVSADVSTNDVAPVADISANETRKVTVKDFAEAGYRLSSDGSIPLAKVEQLPNTLDGSVIKDDSIGADQIAPDAITSSELGDGSVDTAALQDGAVTTPKLADDIDAAKLLDGSITTSKIGNQQITNAQILDATIDGSGKIAPGTVTGGPGGNIGSNTITADNIGSNAIGSSELADASVDTTALQDQAVTGPKLNAAAFNRGLSQDVDGKVGITNEITPGSHAGITFDEQGLITGATTPIPTSDLPIATTAIVGAVSIPGDGGLVVDGGGAVRIGNTVAPSTGYKVTYTKHGLVLSAEAIASADLPIATDIAIGGVMVPNTDASGAASPLSVSGTGSLQHDDSGVVPGIYPKVTIDKFGHVTGGANLDALDIPEIPADNIVGGELNMSVIPSGSVTAEMMADYATSFMQDANPGEGDYLGQLWYSPETAQLNIFARGSNGLQWLPVGYGRLSAENLRWGGLVNADTGLVTVLTEIGQSAGLQVGMAPLEATDALGGLYLVVDTSGSNIGVLPGTAFDAQDWLLCINEAQGWTKIDNAAGGGGGGGSSTLAGLLDTEITTPQDGDLLVYSGGDGKWVNGPLTVIDGGVF